ncbi:Polyhydroxyalkanoate granule-associated protein PhaI [Pseudomonas syringae pv. syringae]|nr:Polyhydroxyalkanoate granule-associated protein PhaI [Pseudomonas syringae pv. syringae]
MNRVGIPSKHDVDTLFAWLDELTALLERVGPIKARTLRPETTRAFQVWTIRRTGWLARKKPTKMAAPGWARLRSTLVRSGWLVWARIPRSAMMAASCSIPW